MACKTFRKNNTGDADVSSLCAMIWAEHNQFSLYVMSGNSKYEFF